MNMKNKIFFISLIVFLFIIAFNIPSFASFYISDFVIDAKLESNGDMEVKETISYYSDETVNGLTREILTKNELNNNNSASGLELLGVYVQGAPCEMVSYAQIGDNMVYEYTRNGTDTYKIKLYTPFTTNTKIVEYDYILKDVAVKYNDIGELYWNFIGNKWDSPINNLTINITLPEIAGQSTSYVYGHGSDNGTFTKIKNKINLVASNIKAYQALDARILFAREAISDAKTEVNKNVLKQYIYDEEGFYPNQEERKILGNFSVRTLAEVLTFLLVSVWFAAYVFYDKEYSVEKFKYYREIPYDLEPELLQYLYYGKVTNSSYYIGFLNLIKLGVFKLEERANKVGKKVQYIIYNNGETVKLTEAEKTIKSTIKRFLEKDEKTGEESIDVLTLSKKMENSTSSGFETYKNNLEDAKETLFGEPTKVPKKILFAAVLAMISILVIITISAITISNGQYITEGTGIILPFFLGFIALVYTPFFATAGSQLFVWIFLLFHCGCFQGACIGMMVSSGVGWLYIPYILCFILIQYLIRIKKYSKEEREVIAKIKGLRKYIKDYSLMRERDGLVENIALWEDYFIIAIALGLNAKTINYFYNYGKEQVNSNLGMSMYGTRTYTDFHYTTYNSFYNYQRSYNISNSISGGESSYSGSSGGFSGGSSSGGGGGRRRRWRTLLKQGVFFEIKIEKHAFLFYKKYIFYLKRK